LRLRGMAVWQFTFPPFAKYAKDGAPDQLWLVWK
jgi:hypothetical protein